MQTQDYLAYLVKHIHTTVIATVDEDGLPITCAIDIMDSDTDSLYFLTAKGKGFYNRLIHRGYIALTGMNGADTLSSVALSVRGKVRELGNEKLQDLFYKNPYMNDIYPTEQSRMALTVFQLYEGVGEWFDLSKKPIERDAFSLGGAKEIGEGYFITDRCIGCKICYSKCPQKCINIDCIPASIKKENCLHCGNCFHVCPVQAVEKRG